MGPLVPSLFLVPVLGFFAWLFLSVAVVGGVPIFSAVFVIAALAIVWSYHRRYASFAEHAPDRLQSEEYRYGMAQIQMIAAKELPHPMPADGLALALPTENPLHLPTEKEEKSEPPTLQEEQRS